MLNILTFSVIIFLAFVIPVYLLVRLSLRTHKSYLIMFTLFYFAYGLQKILTSIVHYVMIFELNTGYSTTLDLLDRILRLPLIYLAYFAFIMFIFNLAKVETVPHFKVLYFLLFLFQCLFSGVSIYYYYKLGERVFLVPSLQYESLVLSFFPLAAFIKVFLSKLKISKYRYRALTIIAGYYMALLSVLILQHLRIIHLNFNTFTLFIYLNVINFPYFVVVYFYTRKERERQLQQGRESFGAVYNLTERELEIALQIQTGKTNSKIAEALFISEKTLEKHISNLYRKTKVKNKVQLTNKLAKDIRL